MRLIRQLTVAFARRAGFALALSGLLAPAFADTPAKTGVVSIFAAASLKNALDEAAADWKARTGGDLAISYASSFPLARQIEAGAPADLFIGADEESMDYLAAQQLIAPESRKDLLANELVLVAPKGAAASTVALTADALAAALAGGRLSVGDPSSVPAGQYAKASLIKLGLWDGLKDRLAPADNVRSALLYVSRGETPLGIVYATDAQAAPEVKIVARFPDDAHEPIHYPIALIATAKPEAARVLEFLEGPEAAKAFVKQGFVMLGGS